MLLNCSCTTSIYNSLFEFTKRPRRSKPDTHSHLLVWAFLWIFLAPTSSTDLKSNNKKIIEWLLSLRKHPFLLALRRWGRSARNFPSGEEWGETDVFEASDSSLLQVRNAFWVSGGRRRGTKSIRARVRARENRMKPSVRTSFLGTRPSCLPSPGGPFFCTDDRNWAALKGAAQ